MRSDLEAAVAEKQSGASVTASAISVLACHAVVGRGKWLVLSEREGLERLTEVLETSDHDPFDAAEAVDWKGLARDEHAQHESALPAAPKQGVEHDSSMNELRQLEAACVCGAQCHGECGWPRRECSG